jgi:hypothetical protein
MCTLAISLGGDRRWPLVVAANRDEQVARPSEGWALRDGPIRYAAPRDLEAGGTWIGVSARGVLAAVTNFHSGTPPDRSRRSRGELVALALVYPSAQAAQKALSALDAGSFNPFHLLVADGDSAFLLRYDGTASALDELGPGLHVITESSPEGKGPRGDLMRARWPISPSPDKLRELITVHSDEPWSATCIHMEPKYATRSSAIIRLAPSLEHSELYVSDGPPCRTPLEDRSELLAGLG